MRLKAFLSLPGGIPEQGKHVTFRLRYSGPDGVPHVKDVTGQLLPLSEVETTAIRKQATEHCTAPDASLNLGNEELVRLLQASLRDADNPKVRLVETDADIQALRDGLVAPQYDALMAEYQALIDQEYPREMTKGAVADLRGQAQDFSASDQPARG